MEMFLFFMVAYGITNIVIFGSIFEGFRNTMKYISPNVLGKLFSCPMCFSTWVGFSLSIYLNDLDLFTPFNYYGLSNLYVKVFLDGCVTSGVIWLIHTIQEYYEYRNEQV